jgi:hypothetical protein
MVDTEAKPGKVGPGAPTITVTVFAPRSPEPKVMTFAKNERVGDAAQAAAAEFGYTGGNPTFAKGGTVLDRAKPLVAEGVRDGDELELVDAGSGV